MGKRNSPEDDEPSPAKPTVASTPPQLEQRMRIIEEYAYSLREIIKTIQRKLMH